MNTFERLVAILELDTGNFEKNAQEVEKKGNSLEKVLTKVGTAAIVGAGAGIAAVGGFLFSAIEPASDLSETANKINVVFGEASDAVNKFAAQSATDFGMSKQSALDAAATFGVFGKSAGKSGEDLADFSSNLVGLSADFASFYNTTPQEAAEAIGAGLRGETEPLRKYGILLDDASMRQEALAMGLIKTTKDALTPQQKVLSANALIMKQGSLANGDFKNTSSGLANQQRIVAATLENTKTVIGTALLPAVGKLATTFSTWLSDPAVQTGIVNISNGIGAIATQAVTYLPQVTSAFQTGFGWLKDNQAVVVGALSAIGTAVIATVVPAIISFVTAAAPVILIMGAIGLAAGLLYQAWTTNFGGIQDKAKAVWDFLQPVFTQAKDWLGKNIPIAIQKLSDFWTNTLYPAIEKVWSWMNANLFPFLSSLGNLIGVLLVKNIEVASGIFQNILLPALRAVWSFLSNTFGPVLNWIGDIVGGYLTRQFENFTGTLNWLKDRFNEFSNTLKRMTLPSWLRPGSPPPLYFALQDINSAMTDLNQNALSDFSANISMNGVMSPAALTNSQNNSDKKSEKTQSKNNYDEKQLAKYIVAEVAKLL